MNGIVVLQWYYNDRDGKTILPELTAVFGPFPDRVTAQKWVKTASGWGGWGRYEYQMEDLVTPTQEQANE